MTSSHILVHALDSVCTGQLTILLVHVVRSRARIVAEPDTKVLHLQGLLLVDLIPIISIRSRMNIDGTHDVDTDNLTRGLLYLLQLAKKVPETALGDDLIGRKDAHAVDLGCWVVGGRQMAPDDLELLVAHLLF